MFYFQMEGNKLLEIEDKCKWGNIEVTGDTKVHFLLSDLHFPFPDFAQAVSRPSTVVRQVIKSLVALPWVKVKRPRIRFQSSKVLPV